jgi:hypothetical protein
MKRVYWLPFICLLFLLPACLTVETILTRIYLNGNNDLIHITILYDNISSAETLGKDVDADFEYLIDQAEDENYLLERLEQGFYIKKRRLFIRENKIMAEEELITRNTETLKNEFNLALDSTVWTMMLDKRDNDFEVISHNGKMVKTEETTSLTWPKEVREIYWKSRLRQLPESFERNRKQMVRELQKYLETTKDPASGRIHLPVDTKSTTK